MSDPRHTHRVIKSHRSMLGVVYIYKFQSGQLSIATSNNPSVVKTIYIYIGPKYIYIGI